MLAVLVLSTLLALEVLPCLRLLLLLVARQRLVVTATPTLSTQVGQLYSALNRQLGQTNCTNCTSNTSINAFVESTMTRVSCRAWRQRT